MFDMHAALLIGVIAAVTAMLRFLPFLLFGIQESAPQYIRYLSGMLPFAIMGMLVVYCLRGVSFAAAGSWLPQLISAAVVVLLHLWRGNTLFSIIGGTVCNMLLVQLVFV